MCLDYAEKLQYKFFKPPLPDSPQSIAALWSTSITVRFRNNMTRIAKSGEEVHCFLMSNDIYEMNDLSKDGGCGYFFDGTYAFRNFSNSPSTHLLRWWKNKKVLHGTFWNFPVRPPPPPFFEKFSSPLRGVSEWVSEWERKRSLWILSDVYPQSTNLIILRHALIQED